MSDSSTTGTRVAALESDMSPAEDTERIATLARSFSLTRTFSSISPDSSPFMSEDSRLDPKSKTFSPELWVKTMLHAFAQDPAKFARHAAGVSWRNLDVHGYGDAIEYQKNVMNVLLRAPLIALNWFTNRRKKVQILSGFDGLVKSGEMLLVLGRPGSGVSTLLKTIAGHTHGLHIDGSSEFNFQGISWDMMHSAFRGEVIYQAETDVHFPQLTVGDTLLFTALARTPQHRISNTSRAVYAEHLRDVAMAMFGISHTINTRVGSEYVRGVSGGERKRVSIAEATLNQSTVQCWDNSTRGLDSATALEFVKTLRLGTRLGGASAIVALYQASEPAYQEFDKVLLLYEGRQIYFGTTTFAKKYFTDMGYHCAPRQTTADFLTSLTNPQERVIQPGFEDRVPRTPDQFADEWRMSQQKSDLIHAIASFQNRYPLEGDAARKLSEVKNAQKTSLMSNKSPYTISMPMQIRLCLKRGILRLQGDKTFFIVTVLGNLVISLVLGSVYFELPENAESMNSRCSVLFFAILFNGLSSALEILSLYSQRPIVEKHYRYALYRPVSEALSSIICDLPSKVLSTLAFNVPLYFMVQLRQGASFFFTFLLFGFTTTLTMSMILRTIGQSSKTVHQALVPAAIFIIGLVIYAGFVLPIRSMKDWLRWLNYINPIAYSYEAIVANEFSGRVFPCQVMLPAGPGYEDVGPLEKACSVAGAKPGDDYINGDFFIGSVYQYYHSHIWRNFGILVTFAIFFYFTYLMASQFFALTRSKGEVLVFRRPNWRSKIQDEEAHDKKPPLGRQGKPDAENGVRDGSHPSPSDTEHFDRGHGFSWQDVCYDITVKDGPRRLLQNVDGWVRPGQITALMGVSGAGKTTLLDVLANRVTMGVVSGDIRVDGKPRSVAFQRTTGYVQQQDIHLETSTVREALRFSALLRQSPLLTTREKYDYVEEVIDLLEMSRYADAIIGVLGEGLNVEQRKRLSIGVELAAKPKLLLFLDEPTSGLDSQTAWAIASLIKKLSDRGQAILCTIHQPSAVLFQQFDRLLLLASGGQTVYFGDIGANSSNMIEYFERHGATPCEPEDNPAEWMLRVIGAAPGAHSTRDWAETWRTSPEYVCVREEVAAMAQSRSDHSDAGPETEEVTAYSASFGVSLLVSTMRVAEQYWRTPSYVYAKVLLCLGTSLFIGLSFEDSPLSMQGLQNQMFSMFMLVVTFAFLLYQSMPTFITQRTLYESRERSSRTYAWYVFILANGIVEMFWNSIVAIAVFLPFYFLVGMYKNGDVTGTQHERGALMFLLIWVFMVYEGTFAHMCVAGAPTAEVGATFALLLFMMILVFSGVLVPYSELPGFWTFLYRASPMTYLIGAMLSTGVALEQVHCSELELLRFNPPSNLSCDEYIGQLVHTIGGLLMNPNATETCIYCPIASTDAYLARINIYYSERWRNFGLIWAFVLFNTVASLCAYWLWRVPKKGIK